MLSFVVRSFKDSVTGDKVFRCLSTITTSQISLYFGSEVFSLLKIDEEADALQMSVHLVRLLLKIMLSVQY